VKTGGRTEENISLSKSFVDVMMDTYAGTRVGRQELDGELIEDVEGSLWPRELIERARVPGIAPCPSALGGAASLSEAGLDKIVVGVDPPAGAGSGCDACGIIVAGRREGKLYVLADESCQGLSPDGWAKRVAGAVSRWDAGILRSFFRLRRIGPFGVRRRRYEAGRTCCSGVGPERRVRSMGQAARGGLSAHGLVRPGGRRSQRR
jgi:phage terminase large subunit-like protein